MNKSNDRVSISSSSSSSRSASPGRRRSRDGSRSRRRRSRSRNRRSRDRDRRSREKRRSASYRRGLDRSNSRGRGDGDRRRSPHIVGNPAMSRDPRFRECRLYIGNIPTTCDPPVSCADLEQIFSKHGKVLGMNLLKGFAFIQYNTVEEAVRAVEIERGVAEVRGMKLDVKIADDKFKNGPDGPFDRWGMPPGFDPRYPPPMGMPPFIRGGPPPFGQFPPPPHFERGEFPPAWGPFPPHPMHGEPPPYRFGYDMGSRPLPPPPRMSRSPSRRRDRSRSRGSRSPPGGYRPLNEKGLPECDCVIILYHSCLRSYSRSVSKALIAEGLTVDTQILDDGRGPDLTELLDVSTNRGTPLAVVITQQNEHHRSVTVNILHGMPQEHRNMPLSDAIDLCINSFDDYKRDKRNPRGALRPDEPAFLPPTRSVLYLLNLLADSRYLTHPELEDVIRYLEDRRDRLLEERGEGKPAVKKGKVVIEDEQTEKAKQEQLVQSVLELLRKEQSASQPNPNPSSTALFPILSDAPADNSAAGVLSAFKAATSAPVKTSTVQDTTFSTPSINLDNPNIQKALDHLMSSGGSSLFQSLSQGPLMGAPAANPPEVVMGQGAPQPRGESRLNFVGSAAPARPQYDDWRQMGI